MAINNHGAIIKFYLNSNYILEGNKLYLSNSLLAHILHNKLLLITFKLTGE